MAAARLAARAGPVPGRTSAALGAGAGPAAATAPARARALAEGCSALPQAATGRRPLPSVEALSCGAGGGRLFPFSIRGARAFDRETQTTTDVRHRAREHSLLLFSGIRRTHGSWQRTGNEVYVCGCGSRRCPPGLQERMKFNVKKKKIKY
eukprot:scaffold6438_cov129-Isochrysis_galbana.AAC.1